MTIPHSLARFSPTITFELFISLFMSCICISLCALYTLYVCMPFMTWPNTTSEEISEQIYKFSSVQASLGPGFVQTALMQLRGPACIFYSEIRRATSVALREALSSSRVHVNS